jgi:hypothetical protein
MLIHVFPPDEKYFKPVQEMYETAHPSGNRFLVVGPNSQKFQIRDKRILFVGEFDSLRTEFLGLVTGASAILFHFLDVEKIRLVELLPPGVPLIWHSWGMDLVKAIHPSPFLISYKPDTRRLVSGGTRFGYFKKNAREQVKRILRRSNEYQTRLGHSLGRFSGMTTGTEQEYAQIKSKYGTMAPTHHPFSYVFLDASEMRMGQGENILLGNSSWAYNNHAEAFSQLRRSDLSGRKVIVPLSYGDVHYREQILKLGHQMLGEHFMPLHQFMPREEYGRVMSSCGYFISNSVVQMAAGNILLAIEMGLRVYLDPCNPFFSFYRSHGLKIDDVRDIGAVPGYCFKQLPGQIRQENFRLAQSLFSKEVVFRQCKDLCRIYEPGLSENSFS